MKIPKPQKMANGGYRIQLRLGGVSVPVTAETEKECIRLATLKKAEHMAEERTPDAKKHRTLKEAINKYTEARTNTLSPATIRGYNIIRDNRFQDVIDTPLNKIDWQKECNKEAALCSAKTLRNSYGFIVSVLSENGITPPKVKLPQVIKNERPWLDPDEIKKFVSALKDEPIAPAAFLALHSLRRSEIYAVIQSGSVDAEKGIIHVHGAVVPDEQHKFVYKEESKNRSSRRDIPIMIPELLALAKDGKLALPCSPNSVCAQINRVCRKNGLPEVGTHGLRHSFASLAYHLGMSEMETMELGGWSDAATMRKIYTHLAKKDKLKSQNKISEFFQNCL